MNRLYFPSLPYGLIVAVFSWLGAANAPARDIYLKMDGIKGESTALGHEEWIEIQSFSHGMTRAATYGTPGTERTNLGDIIITREIDKSSPKLYLALCTGQVISSGTIEMQRTYGMDPTPRTYLRVRLQDVIVTSYKVSATQPNPALTESGGHLEEVSFSYRKIDWAYTRRDPGTGAEMEQVTAGWDAAADLPMSPAGIGDWSQLPGR